MVKGIIAAIIDLIHKALAINKLFNGFYLLNYFYRFY